MNKIHKLSLHEAQKIAAGEVIDRPAHCIKELVENSVDAGATAITVECGKSGKEYIRVIDNGCGIGQEDLLIAYQRHTTSKINTCDDLQHLHTFGFRGEALASMCAVAKVIFTSKTDEDNHATELIVENQRVTSKKSTARVTGTTVQIDDLFGTIPARKKFLKQDSTEWNHGLAVLKSFVAQHRSIHFIIKHDNYLVYNCPPVSLYKDRLNQLFGAVIDSHLHEIEEYQEKGITIEGAVTDSLFGRFDKSGIFIFVNKRLVKNYHLIKAVLQGYENSLQPGKFPAAIISITLDPTVIDVNVHPKKEEILFQFAGQVDKAISSAVKKTLFNVSKPWSLGYSPTSFAGSSSTQEMMNYKNFEAHFDKKDFVFEEPFVHTNKTVVPEELKPFTDQQNFTFLDTQENLKETELEQSLVQEKQHRLVEYDYTVIGIVRRTYIMVEDEQGVLMIDQHALHERMLYNQWSMQEESFETISLLFTATFSLMAEEYSNLIPYLQLLGRFGIVFEQVGATTFRVTSVPLFLKNEPTELIIREMLTWIKEEKEIESQILYNHLTEKLRALISCKSAIKAGDVISSSLLTALLQYFYSSDNCLTCPHGRPIFWRLTMPELEKKFKRDYRY